MAGRRIPRGATYGKTNERGTEVVENEVDHAALFHTYLAALDVDTSGSFLIDGREIPIANPAAEPIHDLLS